MSKKKKPRVLKNRPTLWGKIKYWWGQLKRKLK